MTVCLRSLLLASLLFLSLTATASDWKKISGKVSYVEYLQGNETVADSLLKIAELSIPEIARMTGVPLSDFTSSPCRIVLTDAPDITNGFAIGNTVVIYSLSSMYIPFWTGTIGWYHQVLTHELVHHVTFRAVSRKLSPWVGALTISDVPRWFWEGTAQYYSEYWNAYRGDLYVKNAVFDGSLSYQSMNSLEDGRLLYASGHAFIRFLADQYGDSSLIKLMHYKPDDFLYEFDEAFKSVYAATPAEIFPRFHRHLVLYYGSRDASLPVSSFDTGLPVAGYSQSQLLPVNLADSTWLTVSRLAPNHLYSSMSLIRQKKKGIDILETVSTDVSTQVLIQDDKEWIAWGRPFVSAANDQETQTTSWTVRNLDTELERTVAKNVRAVSGTLFREGLVLPESESHFTRIVWYPFAGGEPETLSVTPWPVGRLSVSADGKSLLAEIQQPNGNRDLAEMSPETGKFTLLTNDPVDDRLPVSVNDSLILFNRYFQEHPSLAVLNTYTGKVRPVLEDLSEYWVSGLDRKSGKVILSYWKPGRKTAFVSVPADSLCSLNPAERITPETNRVSAWTRRSPEFGDVKHLRDTVLTISERADLPDPQNSLMNIASLAFPYTTGSESGLAFSTTWLEALQRQAVQVTAAIPFGEPAKKFTLGALWMLTVSDISLGTVLFHGPALFSFAGEDYLDAEQWLVSGTMGRTFKYSGNPRLSLTPSAGFLFSRRDYEKKSPGLPDRESFYGPSATLAFSYRVPSTYNSVIEKRRISADASLFRSMDEVYDFSVFNFNLTAGTNLYLERLGIVNKFSAIRKSGNKAPRYPVGIDRFYGVDVPRDYGFTRTVRGLQEDIEGNQVFWNQTELTYLLAPQTPFVLLILPVSNVAVTAFADGAYLRTDKKNTNIHSVGGELSFGEDFFRFGAGYAKTKGVTVRRDETVYFRLKLIVPEL